VATPLTKPEETRAILILTPGLRDIDVLARALSPSFRTELRAAPDGDPPAAVVLSLDPGGPALAGVQARSRGVPLIGVTGDPDAERYLDWLARGVSGWIPHPYDAESALDMVKSVLHLPAPADADAKMEISAPVQDWVELSAPSHGEYLKRFDRFFQAVHRTGFDPAVKRQISMALYELGQNAIEWGNRKDINRRLRIAYCLFEDKLVFKIEDEGEGFKSGDVPDMTKDPVGQARARKAEGKRPGGFGMQMIRKVMDNVLYNEKGNVVIVEKKLPPRA
jgi:anti-sigma regulatory factor (Ser/Thr protein kinase)